MNRTAASTRASKYIQLTTPAFAAIAKLQAINADVQPQRTAHLALGHELAY